MSYVLNLAELDRTQVSRVGGKNANLGEMIRVGIQVPLGFAVSVDAYHRFVEREGVGERIEYLLTGVDVEDPGGLEEKSGEIRELILNSSMPDDVAREIRASYGSLCSSCGQEDIPVAARSSATAEDLPDASFAGQQDTYLWVMGAQSVLDQSFHRSGGQLSCSPSLPSREGVDQCGSPEDGERQGRGSHVHFGSLHR